MLVGMEGLEQVEGLALWGARAAELGGIAGGVFGDHLAGWILDEQAERSSFDDYLQLGGFEAGGSRGDVYLGRARPGQDGPARVFRKRCVGS